MLIDSCLTGCKHPLLLLIFLLYSSGLLLFKSPKVGNKLFIIQPLMMNRAVHLKCYDSPADTDAARQHLASYRHRETSRVTHTSRHPLHAHARNHSNPWWLHILLKTITYIYTSVIVRAFSSLCAVTNCETSSALIVSHGWEFWCFF